MSFYAYRVTADGKEPLGTSGRLIMRDLSTVNGAMRRMKMASRKGELWRLFSFTNFYDESSFKRLAQISF